MQSPLFQTPIETDTLTMVLIRVACRQAELDYRRQPHLYATYPPGAVIDLAERQRKELPGINTFSTLIYVAKALMVGYKLRDIPNHYPERIWRSIHKRRVGRTRG